MVDHETTRVTNPSRGGMKKGETKPQFAARMKRARSAAARRRNAGSKSKGKKTTMAARKRRTTRKSPARRRRRPNPKLAVGGVKVGDVVRNGVGVLGGAYLGGAVANFLGSQVDKLGAGRWPKALALFAAGGLVLGAGEYVARRAKDLPVRPGFAALSAPLFLRSLESAGVTPTGYAAPAALPPAETPAEITEELAGGFGAQVMRGGLAISPGPYPGGGAMGWSPDMRGGFASMLP